MRGLFILSAFVALSGCAAFAPLDEKDRTRIRVVAPTAAQFPPTVEFKTPPGKPEGSAMAAGGAAGAGALWCVLIPPYCPAFLAIAPATIVGFGAAGAAGTPANEGLDAMIGRVRSHLGARDVQQLLMQRFSQKVTLLTPYALDLRAATKGPQSTDDAPSYSGIAAEEGTLVAEVAIGFVAATLVEPFQLFGTDYASRPLRIVIGARMRLVRPSDGALLMTRHYVAGRYGRRIKEYHDNDARLPNAIAAAVDEVATLMIDDAFLLHSDAAGTTDLTVPVLEPVPGGACLATGYDCWAFLRVPTLDTASPRFRWEPFPQSKHLENAPWLRTARNFVYDLWIFGGDEDRLVEGLKTTEHTLERPLAPCMRYSWAVRVRFDTRVGPRAIDWSTSSAFHKSAFTNPALRPTFGTPFITPCPSQAGSSSIER
jgi:hypothetical protein